MAKKIRTTKGKVWAWNLLFAVWMAAFVSQVYFGWTSNWYTGKPYPIYIGFSVIAAYLWIKSFNHTSYYLGRGKNIDNTAEILSYLLILLIVPIFGMVGALVGIMMGHKLRADFIGQIKLGIARPAAFFILIHAASSQAIWIDFFGLY